MEENVPPPGGRLSESTRKINIRGVLMVLKMDPMFVLYVKTTRRAQDEGGISVQRDHTTGAWTGARRDGLGLAITRGLLYITLSLLG